MTGFCRSNYICYPVVVMIRTAAVLLVFVAASPSVAGPIDHLIVQENPCSGLKFEQGGITVAIDVTQDVALDEFSVVATGDSITTTLNGHLACETGPEALVSATLSATVEASAILSANTCSATAEVSLSEFGGTLKNFAELMRTLLEASLRDTLRSHAESECHRLLKS